MTCQILFNEPHRRLRKSTCTPRDDIVLASTQKPTAATEVHADTTIA